MVACKGRRGDVANGANDLEVAIFVTSIQESLPLQFSSPQLGSLQAGSPEVGSDRHNFVDLLNLMDRFDQVDLSCGYEINS